MQSKTKFSLILLLTIALFSCKKGKFKTNDSDFQHIFNNLIDSGKEADEFMDTEVHSYTFVLSENKTIKSIGYESQKSMRSTDYVIEIIKNTDSSIVYTGNHKFNFRKLSYVVPNYAVNLESGVHYTIKRIQTNWGQDISNTIGHLVRTEASNYPLNSGVLSILESNFYDSGETFGTKFFALPRIDIVFR